MIDLILSKKITLFWCVLGLTFTIPIYSQNFGGVPPKQKWYVQESEHAKVIYNPSLTYKASDILQTIDKIKSDELLSLGNSALPVPIILRNHSLQANGFVSYAPFRSEFYLYGPQDPNVLGYGNWLDLLTHHEYRHVLQFSNFKSDILKPIDWFLGNAAMGGMYHFLVPNWFSEGEAVYYETLGSEFGRSNLPAFSADIIQLLQANVNYSYAKWRNGSLQDFVPNHYAFGHVLVKHGYEKYGSDFWETVLSETGKLKGVLWPFARSIKRNTGLSIDDFSDEAFQSMKASLPNNSNPVTNSTFDQGDQYRRELQYIPYTLDQAILLEGSYDEITTVYLVDQNEKKALFPLGKSNDRFLKLQNNEILYINNTVHPRWTNVEYGDIIKYNIDTGKKKKVTHRGKFLSFDFQPITKQYYAINASTNGEQYLVQLNEQGKIQDTLYHEPEAILAYPSLSPDYTFLYFTKRNQGQMSVLAYEIHTKKLTEIIPPINGTISQPDISNQWIMFSSSISGIDQIYGLDLNSNSFFHFPSDHQSAYFPSWEDRENTVIFSKKTALGERIHSVTADHKVNVDPLFHDQNRQQSSHLHSTTTLAEKDRPQFITHEKRYHPWLHLFRFHSVVLSPSITSPKLSWLSNDYLNMMQTNIYGQYYDNDQSYAAGIEATYGQSFLQMQIQGQHRMNMPLLLRYNDELYSSKKTETSLTGGIILPLNLSQNATYQNLTLGYYHSLINENFDISSLPLPSHIRYEPDNFHKSHFRLDWQWSIQQAYKDLFPKWGSYIHYNYNEVWNEANPNAHYTYVNLYFPGLFKNDGFKFNFQGQWNTSLAANYIPTYLNSPHLPKLDQSKLIFGHLYRLNYLFPLAYPEFSISPWFYTKRIAINLFGEYYRDNTQETSHIGIDFFLTSNYLNLFEASFGIRNYLNINTRESGIKLLFFKDL